MITFKVRKIKRNSNLCIIHSRYDFDVLIEAHNTLVDALDVAYNEINRLSEEIERLKAGKQNE